MEEAAAVAVVVVAGVVVAGAEVVLPVVEARLAAPAEEVPAAEPMVVEEVLPV